MNLLLDTHIFLWLAAQPDRLTAHVSDALQNPENELLLSVASVWEIQIKIQIGKLSLPMPIETFVSVQRSVNQIRSVPIVEFHIWLLGTLPMPHKDPFDRLLVAQAMAEKCRLVTVDPVFEQYPVQLLP